MAQLDADQYIRLTPEHTYGQSDGLYWDKTNSLLVMVIDGVVKLSVDASGTVLAGAIEAPDLEVSGETRGDLLARGASLWARLAVGTTGQILNSDGTDPAWATISGDATMAAGGALTIAAAAVEASMLGANLRKGVIQLDISTLKIIAGDAIGNTTEGLLPDGNTAPSLARVNGATDKALRVVWASSSSVEVQFPPIVYPPDLDDTAAVEVHLLAAMAGATDTPTITIGYYEGVGDTNAGGATGPLNTTVADVSVSIAHGDVGAAPKAVNIVLTPGAHTTDALWLYGAYVQYTRKT